MSIMRKVFHFIKEVFSENGQPSSKRIVGGLGLLVVHVGWLYALKASGLSYEVVTLGEVLIITDGSLLGITSVSNAVKSFGKNKEE